MNKPRKNTMRERAWKLMRTLGTYTLSDLATIAEADQENISHYHQCLVKAGYAKQVGTRKQEGRSGADKLYRLTRNTGPKPPVQKALRFLYDQNTGEYWSEDPELAAMAAAQQAHDCGRESVVLEKGSDEWVSLKGRVVLLCPRKKKVPDVA